VSPGETQLLLKVEIFSEERCRAPSIGPRCYKDPQPCRRSSSSRNGNLP
jgi:hypothetical protein